MLLFLKYSCSRLVIFIGCIINPLQCNRLLLRGNCVLINVSTRKELLETTFFFILKESHITTSLFFITKVKLIRILLGHFEQTFICVEDISIAYLVQETSSFALKDLYPFL